MVTATKTGVTWKFAVALLWTSSRLFYLVQFVKCWQFFGMNSRRVYRSWGKEKESLLSCVHVLHKTWNHVVFVQWRQRNVQKDVMHLQSCCFANLNLLLFCPSRWLCRRRCLSFLLFGGHWSKWLHWFSYAQMTNVKASFIELSIYIYLTGSLKKNQAKFAASWVLKGQKAGLLRPKITLTEEKERKNSKSEEKEMRRKRERKSNVCALSFYIGYSGEKTAWRWKTNLWQ